jgi:hypothetical protein
MTLKSTTWLFALLAVVIAAATGVGVYYARQARAPTRDAPAAAQPRQAASEATTSNLDSASNRFVRPSPSVDPGEDRLNEDPVHAAHGGPTVLNPPDPADVRQNPPGVENAPSPAAETTGAEAKAGALRGGKPALAAPTAAPARELIISRPVGNAASTKPSAGQNAGASGPLAQPKKSATVSDRSGPGIGLPASNQPRGNKGIQLTGDQPPKAGLSLDSRPRVSQEQRPTQNQNWAGALTPSAQPNGLAMSPTAAKKKSAATSYLTPKLAAAEPGLAIPATSKAKSKPLNPGLPDAAAPKTPGSLDMPPSEPNPGTSDLGYYLPAFDGRLTYPPGAIGDAQAAPAFSATGTDPVRPLTLIPQWPGQGQAAPNAPSYPAGLGYQSAGVPRDSIRPLIVAPQLFPTPGYAPQGPSLPQATQFGGGQPANSQAGSAPGAGNSGPPIRVYGVP